MRLRPLTILFVPLLISCSHASSSDPEKLETTSGASFTTGELLFKSGFAPSTHVSEVMADLSGHDDATGFSWDDRHGWIEDSRFEYVVAQQDVLEDFVHSEIISVPGPRGDSTEVLHLQVKGDDPEAGATSRNSFCLYPCEPPDHFQEGYVRYWTKLQNDLNTIVPFENEARLYYLMEWKEERSGKRTERGGMSNYRVNIGVVKDANSDDLYWLITGQQVHPVRETEWQIRNREVPVPLGEWFLIEAYLKKHPTDGRVYFAVNGKVIGDISTRTEHKSDPFPLKLWCVFKLYHHEEWLAKGPTNQWYDDLEIWSSFPPNHSQARPTRDLLDIAASDVAF